MNDKPISPLAANLKLWRTRRGISLSALAREAGISKSTVSELERGQGNPSLDTIWTLAKTLNVSLGTLFTDENSEQTTTVRRYTDAQVLAKFGDKYVASLLDHWMAEGQVEISVVSLRKGYTRNSKGNAPGVIERVVCAAGTCAVGPAGQEEILEQYDLISFEADTPHTYRAISDQATLVVVQQYPKD